MQPRSQARAFCDGQDFLQVLRTAIVDAGNCTEGCLALLHICRKVLTAKNGELPGHENDAASAPTSRPDLTELQILSGGEMQIDLAQPRFTPRLPGPGEKPFL